MNIIICIKQVPETTEVRINPETNTLIRDGVKSIINPFDMYAIEEGIRLKEKFGAAPGGARAIVITMGPPQADAALREAVSMGVDEGILISDRAFAGGDTWATSYTLSKAIQKAGKEFGQIDIVLCGKQASDGDTAQVGPGMSAWLDLPQVTYVKKIEEIKDGKAKVERMSEEGYDILVSPLPAVFTVVKEINTPRLPGLKGMMRAKSAKITTWSAKDIGAEPENVGLKGSRTSVVKIFTPPVRAGGQMLTGEVPEVAEKLAGLLKEVVNG
ncbi:MAG: electron transfer flavoprotein subunit beta/FixA family protein [Deltaproteobacteria bacterium]